MEKKLLHSLIEHGEWSDLCFSTVGDTQMILEPRSSVHSLVWVKTPAKRRTVPGK